MPTPVPVPPRITSIFDTVLPRSGRLVVSGTDFGVRVSGSCLLVGGVDAFVTSWTDTEVRGYVPEAAAPGPAAVQIVTPDGASNTVELTVTNRAPAGRVRWRFRMDSTFAGKYVGVGPDGSVYATDLHHMYALTPDGGLQWVLREGGGRRPIAFGADGTIYTGLIAAIRPDGTVRWQFTPPGRGGAIAGPAVGPDGNIYAVEDPYGGGLGVFSLDPDGNLRWSDVPSPALNPTLNNNEIEFGDPALGQLYFGVHKLRSGPYPSIYCYDQGRGRPVWHYGSGCQITFAKLGPAHRISFVGPGLCGVTALDEDMNLRWNAPPPNGGLGGGIVQNAVGPDGAIYTADSFGSDFWALEPDGTTRWFRENGHGHMANLGVTPDNRLVLDGGRPGFGTSGWLRAYSTADGSLIWQVDFPGENGMTQSTATAHPVFSADGRTAYVTTQFPGNGPGYSYVYAIDVADQRARWSNYGSGWPGTLGVPGLTASAPPVLGSTVTLRVDNSLGAATGAALAVGVTSDARDIGLGGTLLVAPTFTVSLQLPPGSLGVPVVLPQDPALSGVAFYLQALEVDAGASHGVSFTPGLRLTLGTQ